MANFIPVLLGDESALFNIRFIERINIIGETQTQYIIYLRLRSNPQPIKAKIKKEIAKKLTISI